MVSFGRYGTEFLKTGSEVVHAPGVQDGVPDGVQVRQDDCQIQQPIGNDERRAEVGDRVDCVKRNPGNEKDDDDDGDALGCCSLCSQLPLL